MEQTAVTERAKRYQDAETDQTLLDVTKRHFRGLFTIPADIKPTTADVAWFAEHGRLFRWPAPHPKFRAKTDLCWQNAAEAVLYHDETLKYVQGLVQGSGSALEPHAWLTNDAGDLFEVTWDTTHPMAMGAKYFGVEFTRDQIQRLIMHFGQWTWYHGFADLLNTPETD